LKVERISRKRKYRGFLLDADGTLFDLQRCESEAIYETLSAIPKPPFEMVKEYRKISITLQQKWEGDLESGSENTLSSGFERNRSPAEGIPTDIQGERFRFLLRRLGIAENLEELSSRYLENLSRKHYLMPHVISLLEFLSRRSLLSLISNGLADVQKNRIVRAELELFFNDIVISQEIGLAKPNPEFFRMAVKRLRLSPHDVLCVGDNPLTDIRGAHDAGIDTCWFNPYAQSYPVGIPPPDYTISDLLQLKDLVVEVS
jgi:HAD superfamily hydrolase (TIGR01549 family)